MRKLSAITLNSVLCISFVLFYIYKKVYTGHIYIVDKKQLWCGVIILVEKGFRLMIRHYVK